MADVRQVFPILADSATGAGEPAISRIEGEAAASQEGLIGFSFKDNSGNVVLPQLTAAGAIPVDTEGQAFTCLDANGEQAAGSLGVEVDVATLTLTNSTLYRDIFVNVSSSRWSRFRLYGIDDVGGTDTETTLSEFVVGPGQYTVCCTLDCLEHTAGATGTVEMRLAGQNETGGGAASSLRATIACKEIT